MIGGTLIADAGGVAFRHLIAQALHQPRLADAGLAGNQGHLAFALFRQVPAVEQQLQFGFPADDVGQLRAMRGVKPAFRHRFAGDGPSLYRVIETL